MAQQPERSQTGVRSGPPTISTIAAHLGLSRATVTHVLNGRANEQRIRPETQERVMQVAEELGYRPNASARAVRAGRFGNVALIQSRRGQYLPDELLAGLTSAIAAKDLHLVLTQVPDVDASGEEYVEHTMRELSVDGVLVNRHGGSTPPFLERIHRLRIPAIFLNSKQEDDSVYPDDLTGGVLATELLLQLGHERIAYVETEFGHIPHYSWLDRRAGYEQAMMAAGKVPMYHRLPLLWHGTEDKSFSARDSDYISIDQRVEVAMALLNGPQRPTAIVAYEMTEAMTVVHAALQLGLRIPQDLSLIQFHNRIDTRYFLPIHTVCNMMKEVGEGAVEMLMEKIEHRERPLPPRIIAEVLLEGASCTKPRR